MSIESNIRKLVPAGLGLDFLPGGGLPALTGPDVAAALGMGHVSDRVMLVGLVAYTKDADLIRKLVRVIEQQLADQARVESWAADAGALQGLARLVVLDYVLEGRCQACGGTGWHSGQGRSCTGCDGSGVRWMSETYKAAMICRSTASWRRTWEPRFRQAAERLTIELDRFNAGLVHRAK